MQSFINYIKIDFYTFYHSKIIKVHFIIPVLAMIPFLSYYSVSPWNELDKVISYIQIISMSFPLIISIILSILGIVLGVKFFNKFEDTFGITFQELTDWWNKDILKVGQEEATHETSTRVKVNE